MEGSRGTTEVARASGGSGSEGSEEEVVSVATSTGRSEGHLAGPRRLDL